MSASSSTKQSTRKHRNFDRELTDAEEKLIDSWRDSKLRRKELSSLIWRRDVVSISMWCSGIGSAVLIAGSIMGRAYAAMGGDAGSSWGEMDGLIIWMIVGTAIIYQERFVLIRSIAAVKYIGQLEDQKTQTEKQSDEQAS